MRHNIVLVLVLIFLVFSGGCISQLVAISAVAGVASNLPKPEPPTSSGLNITCYPNPVPFSSEDGGWAYTIRIDNPLDVSIFISQIEIKGIAKFSIVSFPIPDEIIDAEGIIKRFGSYIIPPGESILWKRVYTRDDIKEMIKDYDSYPGVNVENAIYGLNINIKAKGYDANNNYIEGTTGTVTFVNREE